MTRRTSSVARASTFLLLETIGNTSDIKGLDDIHDSEDDVPLVQGIPHRLREKDHLIGIPRTKTFSDHALF